MQSSDKKSRSLIWRKLAWINLNAKIVDLWTSTWVAWLGSLSQGSGQGGSSSDRECYCKKLQGQIRHWKSEEVQHPCSTWNNSQKICQRWWGFHTCETDAVLFWCDGEQGNAYNSVFTTRHVQRCLQSGKTHDTCNSSALWSNVEDD